MPRMLEVGNLMHRGVKYVYLDSPISSKHMKIQQTVNLGFFYFSKPLYQNHLS